MANVIIGIHGLGNKPPKQLLKKWWKQAMLEGLENNKHESLLPKFELVYWADILYNKPLNPSEKDKSSPYFLDEGYAKASKNYSNENHETRQKVVDYLSHSTKQSFPE